MIHVLSKQHSVLSVYIKELRDIQQQTDRYKFRHNIERIGSILAYEISKEWPTVQTQVQTPLGISNAQVLAEQPVIATVLRAGLPLQSGMAQMFDQADLAYISAYRKHTSPTEFDIILDYVASPAIQDRILILCDPMLATGKSLVKTYKAFLKRGKPKKVYLVAVIGSQEGVNHLVSEVPEADLWIGCIDPELNDHGYIVPGLGDAGDLSFGIKE